jgi:hypothetical protein
MSTYHRSRVIELIEFLDLRHFSTLAFNRYMTVDDARDHLRELHARLDRMTLGPDWAKKDPHNERLFSISFIENPETNLHFHMLWRSPQHEAKLTEAMPEFWEELVPPGDVDTQPISYLGNLNKYVTKQLTPDSYTLSSQFGSRPSHHRIGRPCNAG